MLMVRSRAKGREKEALCENREHWLQTGYQEMEDRVHDHEVSSERCESQLRAEHKRECQLVREHALQHERCESRLRTVLSTDMRAKKWRCMMFTPMIASHNIGVKVSK